MNLQKAPHSSVWHLPDVTCVEVIDSTGRGYVNIGVKNVEAHVQDGERTLKIFLTDMDEEDKKEVIKEMSTWDGYASDGLNS